MAGTSCCTRRNNRVERLPCNLLGGQWRLDGIFLLTALYRRRLAVSGSHARQSVGYPCESHALASVATVG